MILLSRFLGVLEMRVYSEVSLLFFFVLWVLRMKVGCGGGAIFAVLSGACEFRSGDKKDSSM